MLIKAGSFCGAIVGNYSIFVTYTYHILDIKSFIRELLFCHDCVIIPGFGGFISNHIPAQIDKPAGMFHPPVRQVSFNRNLSNNDGLLAGRISERTGMNYGDARAVVEEFASDLRRRLDRGEKVVFDQIGSFANNEEGNIQFEPDREVNYHLDAYGLESFRCMPLEGYESRKLTLTRTDREPAGRVITRRMLWRAAVVVPVVAALVAAQMNGDLFRTRVERSSMNPLVTAEFENNRKAVDDEISTQVSAIAGRVGSPSVETSSSVEVPLASEAVPAPSPAAVYSLITGSFRSEENALVQVNELKAEGFQPVVFQAENGFFRVSAVDCPDLGTASFKRDSLMKKYPGAWISRRK